MVYKSIPVLRAMAHITDLRSFNGQPLTGHQSEYGTIEFDESLFGALVAKFH